MNNTNLIIINGNELSFEEGETILDIARRNNIDIPTLCELKGASPTGTCRICVVEVKGAESLMTACTTPAANGMEVMTESPSVVSSRKETLNLFLASGNHNCAIFGVKDKDWTEFQMAVLEDEDNNEELCPAWGECRLQDLCFRYQADGGTYERSRTKYPAELANPFIIRDFSRCILCGRCVQACNAIQVNEAINFEYEGADRKIAAGEDKELKDSECVFCGECVQACPVGALVEKDARYNARRWNIEKVKTTCTYCGVGCQMFLHVCDNKIVKITGDTNSLPNYGSLCVKGRFGFDFVGSQERLTVPLVRKDGELKEATWTEALNIVAKKFSDIKSSYGGDSIGVLTSARITNEENYLANKFTRAVLNTNNIDHCARLWHSSTVAGLAAAFGSGAMTNTIADIEKADVILITGSNTTENHPVISSFVKRAVKFKDKKLIVVDPRRIKITEFADIWLRSGLGTDVAWINGMMHVIIKEEIYDKKFVTERTVGFEQLKEVTAKFTPEYVENITGIPADQIVEAARLYAGAKAGSILYCMGITQHTTGTDNVKSLANLAMLCGNLGIEGGGVNPLRGQNNVQGACDMGGLPDVYSGYQKVTVPEARKKMETAWNVPVLSDKPGLKATEMIPAAHTGEIKALYVIGENPLVSDADLNHAKKCIEHLDFLVVQDIFLTETAELADVVLPSKCFAEKDGTFSNTERRVQRVRKAVEAPGQARNDWEIISEIGLRMGYSMHYKSAEEIMEEIASVTPSYGGITYKRIEEEGGLHWPCPNAEHPGTPILHIGAFPCGKGVFSEIDYIEPAEKIDEEYPVYLTTGRVIYHYHTGTMTMKTEGLNEREPECFVEITNEDAEKYKLIDGSTVNISSRRGEIDAKVKISEKAVSGTIFIPFHFAKSAANILTNSALDPISKIPEFKICAVKLSSAESN